MSKKNDSIYYSIDELVTAGHDYYHDYDENGKRIRVEMKDKYLLLGDWESVSKKELIEVIEKSIVQLQKKIEYLKCENNEDST